MARVFPLPPAEQLSFCVAGSLRVGYLLRAFSRSVPGFPSRGISMRDSRINIKIFYVISPAGRVSPDKYKKFRINSKEPEFTAEEFV